MQHFYHVLLSTGLCKYNFKKWRDFIENMGMMDKMLWIWIHFLNFPYYHCIFHNVPLNIQSYRDDLHKNLVLPIQLFEILV